MSAALPGYLEIECGASGLRHAPDLIQIAHDHGAHQGEADSDRGGQTVTAMIEPVAICFADRSTTSMGGSVPSQRMASSTQRVWRKASISG
jgi:hypothetical protein